MPKRKFPVAKDSSGKPKPTMRAQWLGQGLRRLREARGITAEEAGRYLQRDASTVTRFEIGIYPARTPDVAALLDLYGVHNTAQRQFLTKLSRDIVEPGWWDQYLADVDSSLIDMAWLEARALRIDTYHQVVIPGLLQTQDYARATIRAADWHESDDHVERWVRLRIDRQSALTRKPPLRFTVILDEACLRREVGGAEIMQGQLRSLLEFANESTVDIRVLPFSQGAHASPTSSFYICEMADPFPQIGYVDTLAGALYVEADTAERFRSVFDNLLSVTLDANSSRAFIEARLKELS